MLSRPGTIFNACRDIVCEEFRAASITMKTTREQGKEIDPVLSPKRKNTQKETVKEIPKGKDPKKPVRQESQARWHACNATHQECSHCDCKSGTRIWREKCVFKHTGEAGEETNGKGTTAITSDERKEFNLCVEWWPYNDVLSTTDSEGKIEWILVKKQFRVRYCHNGARHFRFRERENDHRKELSSEDPENDRNPNSLAFEDFASTVGSTLRRTGTGSRVGTAQHVLQNPRDVPRKQRCILQNNNCHRSCLPDRNQP